MGNVVHLLSVADWPLHQNRGKLLNDYRTNFPTYFRKITYVNESVATRCCLLRLGHVDLLFAAAGVRRSVVCCGWGT